MSLKSKLEAVIYAAEEPVTLAQLTALFAADALAWKAEQEAVCAEQEAADAAQGTFAEPLPLENAEFAYLEPDEPLAASGSPEPAVAEAEPGAEASAEAVQAPIAEEPVPAESPASGEESIPAPEETPAPAAEGVPASAEDAELEERRLARQRDREARAVIRQQLDELIATYATDGRGIEIREIAGGFRMATKPECHDAVRLFVKSLKPALKLSLPALETLAVVAYKQPITAPEVNEIRGVDSSGVFGSLLARKLIATAGRKQVIGRPILYKTTREFLLRFGLKDVTELPSMEEFEKMAASELDEAESAAEGLPAARTGNGTEPEFDETSSEDREESQSETIEAAAETHAAEIPPAGSPAIPAEPTPAEAAPAAPSDTEQAETENSPNDESSR
jgi:segregation and condensation protein B